jgi:hypothetical protein
MHPCHVFQQDLASHFRAVDDVAKCGVYGRSVEVVQHVVNRLVQLAGALHETWEDMDEVEAGLALFDEIYGGFVGDDFRVCESFEVGDIFCRFGWEALSDIVCFCSLAVREERRFSRLTSCAKLAFFWFEYGDARGDDNAANTWCSACCFQNCHRAPPRRVVEALGHGLQQDALAGFLSWTAWAHSIYPLDTVRAARWATNCG